MHWLLSYSVINLRLTARMSPFSWIRLYKRLEIVIGTG